MRLLPIGCAVLAGLAAAPGGSWGQAVTPLSGVVARSDGATTLAYQRDGAPGRVRVLLQGPAGTSVHDVATPKYCSFEAVGARRVVFDCFRPDTRERDLRLYDIAAGTYVTPPGAATLAERERNDGSDSSYTSEALGSRFLRVRVSGNHVDSATLLDRRTGSLLEETFETTKTVPSLDVPEGRVPLCAPLRRPRSRMSSADFVSFLGPVPATYRPPFLTYQWEGRTVLRRCGSARRTILSRQARAAPIMSRTYVAWSAANVHVRFLRSARRPLTWSPPGGEPCATLLGNDRYILCLPGSFLGRSYLLDLEEGDGP